MSKQTFFQQYQGLIVRSVLDIGNPKSFGSFAFTVTTNLMGSALYVMQAIIPESLDRYMCMEGDKVLHPNLYNTSKNVKYLTNKESLIEHAFFMLKKSPMEQLQIIREKNVDEDNCYGFCRSCCGDFSSIFTKATNG